MKMLALLAKSHNKAFTLAEVLVVTLLISSMIGMAVMVFLGGQATWFTSDVKIILQENLRTVLQRVSVELRQTQVAQQNIFNGTGVNSTDVIRFSIPVICKSGGTLLDGNGNVSHWGAPLTWGCSSSTCMDADNNCSTVDYKFIEYYLNSSNQLVRDVLDPGLNLKHSEVIAGQIVDFQASLNGKVVTLTVQARQKSLNGRVLSAQGSEEILLRN